jgi:hypothetical protein
MNGWRVYQSTPMARYTSGHNQPLTHWNNIPVYLTTIVTAAFVLGLIASAVLMSLRSPLLGWLVFEMPLQPGWTIWRLFTYVFVGRVSFFTPFSILFFYWMSLGLETHLGRPALARMLLLLVLVVPAVAALWWWAAGVPSNAFDVNSYMLMSGLLVSFATLYPNTEAWGWVPFKWVAFACIACGSLMLLAGRDWLGLSQLWASCGAAFGYTRLALESEYDDHEPLLGQLTTWWRRRKFSVVKAPGSATAARRGGDSGPAEEMDRLLDKIAKTGLSSLTSAERARLEKAREALLKREGR